jgi:RsiW-degrading membrane proteinase PrsW (M82 family)
VITTLAAAFIQFPLQRMASQTLIGGLNEQHGEATTYLIAGIVLALITALVQQGAKLVPVCLYWWRGKAQFTPQSGLIIGAVAGTGFGLIEAFMRHNQIFGIGLNQLMQNEGYIVILVFLERFFSVAFHAGTTAVAGWGLAKGKGWQFYLIVAGIQFAFNYISVLLSAKILNVMAVEIALYLISMGVMAWALWLRWGKNKEKIQSVT